MIKQKVLPKLHFSTYPLGEEIANSIAHGLGIIFGLVALTMMLTVSIMHKMEGLKIFSFTIYGLSLIGLYLASTLYHSIPNPRAKYIFKILDHCFIFILIAGTYTPFALITLRGHSGPLIISVIWAMAILGIVYKVKSGPTSNKIISAAIYLIMSWTAGIAGYEMLNLLERGCLWYLLGGGLAYTFGTVFYINKKMPYSHAIWHLFVLAGSVLHFFAVFLYLI